MRPMAPNVRVYQIEITNWLNSCYSYLHLLTGPSTTAAPKGKSKINRAFNRFLHKPKSLMNVDNLDGNADTQLHCHSGSHSLHLYR
jgi:hypothetical protein